MTAQPVYLDYAATTPVDARVIETMRECLEAPGEFANAASIHRPGRNSAALVDRSRQQLADLVGTDPARIIWTSGATESDNLAIQGVARFCAHKGRHLVTMPTEHKAVTDTFAALEKEGFEVTWLKPDTSGLLPLDEFEAAIRDDTQLVSIMHVNNETGIIQDIRRIGEVCRERGVLFHTDAAQSVGKLDINLAELPVDLMSITAHKYYGPQGIGALYIADRPGCNVLPITFGGGQERRLRPGTLPVHLIAGIGMASAIAANERETTVEHVTRMRDRLWRGIGDLPGVVRNGAAEHTYPGILNVSAKGVEGESLMLGMEPVCVASGSACNATSGESSYVLRALGRDDLLAQGAVRFSFGRSTTEDDVDIAVERYKWTLHHLRSIAPGHAATA